MTATKRKKRRERREERRKNNKTYQLVIKLQEKKS